MRKLTVGNTNVTPRYKNLNYAKLNQFRLRKHFSRGKISIYVKDERRRRDAGQTVRNNKRTAKGKRMRICRNKEDLNFY